MKVPVSAGNRTQFFRRRGHNLVTLQTELSRPHNMSALHVSSSVTGDVKFGTGTGKEHVYKLDSEFFVCSKLQA